MKNAGDEVYSCARDAGRMELQIKGVLRIF